MRTLQVALSGHHQQQLPAYTTFPTMIERFDPWLAYNVAIDHLGGLESGDYISLTSSTLSLDWSSGSMLLASALEAV